MQQADARILLVDDDSDGLDVLSRLLTMNGYTVQVANMAQKAKELCNEHAFDVMISDIGLPDQTGYELMREIKQRYGIPGIALSGYGSAEDIEESRKAGFDFHVVKPIQTEKLFQTIRAVLGTKAKPLHSSLSRPV